MSVLRAESRRLLVLGPDQGWHASQLREAARQLGHRLEFASYESVAAAIETDASEPSIRCQSGCLNQYDAILTRTMPAASMERITFRLAALHALADKLIHTNCALVNPPRALEWAIDKFASLARLSAAGFPTPATRFVQSRREAMDAFVDLGQDCIVKPIFGGEGRGVMRIQDLELAWYSFGALDQLDAVLQVQAFVPPGGQDTRLLVVNDRVFGIRRSNNRTFRTNVAAGAVCQRFEVDETLSNSAKQIAERFGLTFCSVDLIDNDEGPPMFLEVNAIPGWKGAQSVLNESIAEHVIEMLVRQMKETEP